MSSTTSMPDNPRPRRSPWRALGVLVLLAATAVYVHHVYGQLETRHLAGKREARLAAAGPLAEGIEATLVEAGTPNPQVITTLITPLFSQEPTLAAVRVWAADRTLACEVTRAEPDATRAGEGGILPDMAVHQVTQTVEQRRQDRQWHDTVAHLVLLENEQNALTEQMDNLGHGKRPPKATVREQLREQQQAILELAQTANDDAGTLDSAVEDMLTVLDALSREDDADLSLAVEASDAVAADLTEVLADRRSTFDIVPALPQELLGVAPKPAGWWTRIQPAVRGERVLIPLFTPTPDENLVASAGFAEVLFYDHPGDVLAALNTVSWAERTPAIALLALALLLLLWPRRKAASIQQAEQPVEAAEDGSR